jgi:hypothetical protein
MQSTAKSKLLFKGVSAKRFSERPGPNFESFLRPGGSGNLVHLGCDLVEEGKAIFSDDIDIEV